MHARNEDIALILAGVLTGAGIGGMSDHLAPTVTFIAGLLFLLLIMMNRIRSSLPPRVKSARGIEIVETRFEETSVTLVAVTDSPVASGLWLSCDSKVTGFHASVKEWKQGSRRSSSPVKPATDVHAAHYSQMAGAYFSNLDDDSGELLLAEITMRLEVANPAKLVRVRYLNARRHRRLRYKAYPPEKHP